MGSILGGRIEDIKDQRIEFIETGEVNGRSKLLANYAEADRVTAQGKIDDHSEFHVLVANGGIASLGEVNGNSTATIKSTCSTINIHGQINGGFVLVIDNSGGKVIFHGEINGASNVVVVASEVGFKKKIDNKATTVTVTITTPPCFPGCGIRSRIAFTECYGTMTWSKMNPTDPEPDYGKGQIGWDGTVNRGR